MAQNQGNAPRRYRHLKVTATEPMKVGGVWEATITAKVFDQNGALSGIPVKFRFLGLKKAERIEISNADGNTPEFQLYDLALGNYTVIACLADEVLIEDSAPLRIKEEKDKAKKPMQLVIEPHRLGNTIDILAYVRDGDGNGVSKAKLTLFDSKGISKDDDSAIPKEMVGKRLGNPECNERGEFYYSFKLVEERDEREISIAVTGYAIKSYRQTWYGREIEQSEIQLSQEGGNNEQPN